MTANGMNVVERRSVDRAQAAAEWLDGTCLAVA